eukprot:GDKI01049157.1.p1 GENE.GDKI01049157.1~~GDKI01049157.1.p1  ORF type:complete len:161 (-),score=32.14 GDKI01049157.1:35-517(-)
MAASSSQRGSQMAMLRLMSDWKVIQMEPPEGISASPITEDNMFMWEASIVGPDDTPWEGGIFSLMLKIPPTYPDRPPQVKFTTEMFHPNVYPDGNICLDIIQDQWKPTYTIGSLLTSIQSLLTDPNPASPANGEAAKMYTTDIKEYNKRVRKCASKSVCG